MSLTALEISFDNPVLHRNLSGSFEDEDDDEHEDEGFMLIPSDLEAYATLLAIPHRQGLNQKPKRRGG